MRKFFAKSWPWQIAFWGLPLIIAIAFSIQVYPKTGFFHSILAGSMLGVIVTYAILHNLMHILARINGGPFRCGDKVRILVGQHEGKVGDVYEVWK